MAEEEKYGDNEEKPIEELTEAVGIEEEAEEEKREIGTSIADNLSSENQVSRFVELTRISYKTSSYIFAAAYFVVGILCVSITHRIEEYLPYIVGSLMIALGIARFVFAVVRREYMHVENNRTFSSLILAALGAMIIVQQIDPESDPITLIAVAWGIMGLFEGAYAFNHVLKRIFNAEPIFYYLLKGLVECAVAFMLLYRPNSEEIHFLHIIVFGAGLVVDAITMLPPVKKFLSID